MVDGWSNEKNRTLINFLVNSPKGSVFLKSIDVSNYVKIREKMFELFDRFVERVGKVNVVQVVTDNASANVLAGKLLEAKRPHLYWSPCATHCLDLMLKDIGNLSSIKVTLKRAMNLNGYIYVRPDVVSLLRRFTGQRELVRVGITSFATAFLTLRRIHKQMHNLRKMFTSEDWTNSKWAKEPANKKITKIILMPSFWTNIVYVLKIYGPLVCVLRLVGGEKKHAMGYIHKAMDRAKEAIMKSFNKKEEKYKEVFKIIDNRWACQLHRPLHAAGYYLNPKFFYSNLNIHGDEDVMSGLYNTIERLVPSHAEQDKICEQLILYRNAKRLFGMELAIRHRKTKSPVQWWQYYGLSTPNLQSFAIKVLSLTCSASGCERNWGIFEHIHSKNRSRLAQQRLNDLVFVKYNRMLRHRYETRDHIDPISLNDIDASNEWLMGRMGGESGDENELVFDGDDLTWGAVARAIGVEDEAYPTSGKNGKHVISASTSSARPKQMETAEASSRMRAKPPLVLRYEDEIDLEEDDENYEEEEMENDLLEIDDDDEDNIEFDDDDNIEFDDD